MARIAIVTEIEVVAEIRKIIPGASRRLNSGLNREEVHLLTIVSMRSPDTGLCQGLILSIVISTAAITTEATGIFHGHIRGAAGTSVSRVIGTGMIGPVLMSGLKDIVISPDDVNREGQASISGLRWDANRTLSFLMPLTGAFVFVINCLRLYHYGKTIIDR